MTEVEEKARRAKEIAESAALISENMATVIKGKPEVIDLVLTGLLAEGHLLVEDVPGVGKTSIARALAASIGGEWSRIQFTPDLLPADITGGEIYRQQTGTFEFHRGPVFANVVVADEINRASPKTQSATLEVMEERRVTISGEPHDVPRPFIVVATQNPIEMDGTYRLPEAQVDRFLMRISVGYPDLDAEIRVMEEDGAASGIEVMRPVVDLGKLEQMIVDVSSIDVDASLLDYIARLSAGTRLMPDQVRLGVSPRGSLALMRAVRARAGLQGRSFATADDVRALVKPVFGHRLHLSSQALVAKTSVMDVIDRVVDAAPVPTSPAGA